jgi:hypothetical protein
MADSPLNFKTYIIKHKTSAAPPLGHDHADELLNADTNLRYGWMNVFICMIGPYGIRWSRLSP